jgi:hypothetical protein
LVATEDNGARQQTLWERRDGATELVERQVQVTAGTGKLKHHVTSQPQQISQHRSRQGSQIANRCRNDAAELVVAKIQCPRRTSANNPIATLPHNHNERYEHSHQRSQVTNRCWNDPLQTVRLKVQIPASAKPYQTSNLSSLSPGSRVE